MQYMHLYEVQFYDEDEGEWVYVDSFLTEKEANEALSRIAGKNRMDPEMYRVEG